MQITQNAWVILQTVSRDHGIHFLSEALPIYSGGLGNVTGDQLKAASDLGVPVVGCSTSKAIFAR
jgi:glucan phosphorylase